MPKNIDGVHLSYFEPLWLFMRQSHQKPKEKKALMLDEETIGSGLRRPSVGECSSGIHNRKSSKS